MQRDLHAMMVDVGKMLLELGRYPMQLSSICYSFLRRPLVNLLFGFMGEHENQWGFLHS